MSASATQGCHKQAAARNLVFVSSLIDRNPISFRSQTVQREVYVSANRTFLWSPYVIGQTIIFSCCSFFYLSFFPRLISAVEDWMSTILPHMVWPQCKLECRSEMCCTRIAEKIQDAKKSQKYGHLDTIAQLCRVISLQLRHVQTIRKKNLLSSNMSSRCPEYGELRPTKFQLVSRLGSVTARHVVAP